MKKALWLAIFSLLCVVPAFPPAHATVMGIAPGDLIKLQDDHDPKTNEDRVVYYYDKDWYRHPFPNQRVFESWYRDFSGVKELSKEDMAQLPLGAPITYRPGTRLVKIPSIPKVYAVEPGGVLRWIETEAVAKALYGDAWAKRVDDVSDAYFANYHEGAPLTVPVWPTGTVLRRPSDTALFFVDGLVRRYVSPAARAWMRVNDADVIDAPDMSSYAESGPVSTGDWKFSDASQKSRLETLPRPQFDFPANPAPLEAGKDQQLAAFRLTSGMPVIIRRLTVTVSGPLWDGATPALSDLHFADVNGQELFGIKQLAQQGSTEETLAFDGAYTMPTDTISVIELRAKVAASVPHGAQFTVNVNREGVRLADGGNGQEWDEFYPSGEFPDDVLTVK